MTQDAPDDSRSLFEKRWVRVLFLISMLFVGAMLPALAADLGLSTDPYQMSEGVHLNASNGPLIELGQQLQSDRVFPVDGDTVNVQPVATITGDAGTEATISNYSSTFFTLANMTLAGGSMTVDPQNHPQISVSGGATRLEWRDYALDDGTVDIKLDASNDTTLVLTELATQAEFVTISDDGGTQLDRYFATDASPEFNLDSGGDLHLETADVQFSNAGPPPGEQMTEQSPIELSIDVDHPAFEEGEAVDLQFIGNGEPIDTVTTNQDGTISVEWDNEHLQLGENEWYVVANDSGHTVQSSTRSFTTPKQLDIRDEQTGALINGTNVSIEVQFFPEGEDTVVEKSTTDGTINLTGLPHDQPIIVRADADGYFTREILIRSLTQQHDIYLLNESADAVQIEFQLRDITGNFPETESRVVIEKPLTRNNETRYQTIVAQQFGVSGAQLWLEAEERYRITVANPDGDRRSMGSFVPATAEVIELRVESAGGGIDPIQSDIGYAWDAAYESVDNGDDRIVVQYIDEDAVTGELTIRAYAQGNDSITLQPQTFFQVGNVSHTFFVPDEHANVSAWVIEISGSYDGEAFSARTIVHADVTVSFLPGWLETAAAVVITLLIAGLMGGARADLGAIVAAVTAGVFWLLGWLSGWTSGGMIALALFVAIMYRYGVMRRGVRP